LVPPPQLEMLYAQKPPPSAQLHVQVPVPVHVPAPSHTAMICPAAKAQATFFVALLAPVQSLAL
jgi:hypothetical protein